MQTDKDPGALRRKLDGLRTDDVAAGWDKAAVWQKLAAAQTQHRKKTIYIRAAGVAMLAATLAGLCLIIWPPGRPTRLEDASASIAKAAMAPKAETVAPASKQELIKSPVARLQHIVIHRKTEKMPATAISPHLPLQEKNPAQNGQLPTNDLVIKAPETALSEPPKPALPRPQQIVYTLNEIMADLPEREAPPRRYSGIFHQKAPPADVPERSISRRRPAAMPPDESPAYPHLIN